jgi:hypothetical protein
LQRTHESCAAHSLDIHSFFFLFFAPRGVGVGVCVVSRHTNKTKKKGESRYISTLICNFLEKIDFGQDLEQQLNVFVDCRAAFPNLDGVKDRLVLAVCKLAMKAHQLMKGKHTKKTAAFVKACMAFCHITIPSIESIFTRYVGQTHVPS